MKISHIEFKGNIYEQGLVHGEALRESIEKNIDVYLHRFDNEAGINQKELLKRTKSYLEPFQKQCPEYMRGVEGVAKGSNKDILNILMLNLRYELLYYELGRKKQEDSVDGCTSFAILPESTDTQHLIMGQNWDWIPDVECVLVTNTDPDGLKRLSFVEAGILAGKPGINSEGLGIAVNGMYSTSDDWSRFHKPFHVRCYEILRSKSLNEALNVLTDTPRSCTANFLLGHTDQGAIDIELAPETMNIINPVKDILFHANHFVDPEILNITEPPNPRRYLSEFRHKQMGSLLLKHKPLDVEKMKNILCNHDNHPQSICRHSDNSLPISQQTTTRTSMIMDLKEKSIWYSNGNPCENDFIEYSLNN